MAAVFNNGIDCVQNVFSKKLLSTHYNYVNLQVRPRARATVRVRVRGLLLCTHYDYINLQAAPPPLPSAPAAPL